MNKRISTGIQGLDHILRGGFLASRVYLVYGAHGTGKTTLGLHFLAAGAAAGEACLLITFGQPEESLRREAENVGLNVQGVAFLDLTPSAENFSELHTYDIFSPAEVERDPVTVEIAKAIERTKPQRVFVDSFEQFRQLATDPFHHRRLIQSFFRFVTRQGATLLIACEEGDTARDADGVIALEFGPEGRNLRVTKFRGSDFQAGPQPMRLTDGGLQLPQSAA